MLLKENSPARVEGEVEAEAAETENTVNTVEEVTDGSEETDTEEITGGVVEGSAEEAEVGDRIRRIQGEVCQL